MSRRKMIHLICSLVLLAVTAAAQTSGKKRVAVLDFDYGTVQQYVYGIYGTNQDVGKGITDMLVEKLVKDGKYSVIERKALDKILNEQNFSNSDRANPATAQKIGQILGVDAIIMGSITKFGRDDKSKSVGGLGIGRGGFGIGGVKRNEAKAVCAISARLVDTTTGEILAAVTGEGESKRSGTSLIGAGGGGGGAGGGAFDTHASNFGQTLLGEAVTQAVQEVGSQLGTSAANVPTRKVEVSGVVADVSGNTLIINVGSKTGLKVGDRLEISHAGRQVKDPTTGKVLKTITTKIGEATVTEIDPDSATLSFNGTGPVKVGDIAKTPQE
jgi:curli biogenesis system outer membrane secretion channel CsgG